MQAGNSGERIVSGEVLEALPDANFRLKLETGEEIIAYLAGRMRLHHIRVLIGDRVEAVVDAYGSRARIIKRK